MLVGLTAAGAAAVAFGLAAVLQGVATATATVRAVLDPRLLLELLRSGAFVASVACNVLGFLLHVVALQWLPLFLVQALIASSVAVTAVVAARVLSERLDRLEKAALAAVCAGLALLALSAAEGSAPRASEGVVPSLALVLAGTAGAGAAAGRAVGRWTSAALGLLAGVGFALVAVAARLLPGLTPSALVGSPATWLLLASGAVAVLLYAAAMQRGSVTRATAAMVLTQTVVPSVIGLVLLGDRTREGFAGVGVVGFVLALAGVAVLAQETPPQVRSAG